MWRIWAPELRSNISQNSALWLFSKNFSTGLASVLVYMSISPTFRGVFNNGLRGPSFGSFWDTKYIIIQMFSRFLKYIPLVLHHSCFHAYWGVLLGVLTWVLVAAELVRPPGFLFLFAYILEKKKSEWWNICLYTILCHYISFVYV